MSDESRKVVGSVERALDVLLLIARSDRAELGVTEIAAQLDLSKAVVHRILTTLASRGLIETGASRRYRLGPASLSIGIAYLDRIDIRELARPVLTELSLRSGETATISVRTGWERMYIDQVTPNREVKMTVALGRAFPLHAGSSSKAFLAFLPREEQDRYLRQAGLGALTDRTITDAARLREELDAIRERGYAVSEGERQEGAGSIAAPVFDHHGEPTAVISLCGPLERFIDEVPALRDELLRATAELSRQLGRN